MSVSLSNATIAVDSRRQRVVIWLCFFVLTLEGYDIVVFGSTVPALLSYDSWSLTPERVGFLGSVAVAGMMVGALLSGLVTDSLGRRRVILVSVAVFSVAAVGSALAPTVTAFAIARLFVGVGTGCLMPTVVALVIEYSPVGRRNLNTALAFAGVGVGGALSGLVALAFVPDGHFRPVYLVGALPALVLLPVLIRALPESMAFLTARDRLADAAAGNVAHVHSSSAQVAGRLTSLFRDGYAVPTLIFWVVTFLNLLVLFGTNTWLPSLMTAAGFNVSSALTFLLVLNLGAVAGAIGASLLADRVGPRLVVSGAFCSAAAAFVALSFHPPTAVVYLLVAVAGFGATGTQILVNAYVGASYPTDRRGTGLGMSLGVGRLGGILGPTIGGFLVAAELSQRTNFIAFAVPALVAAVLVIVTAVPIHRDGELAIQVVPEA